MWCFRIDDAKKKKKNDSSPINIKWNNFSLLTGLNGVCWFNIVCGTGYTFVSALSHIFICTQRMESINRMRSTDESCMHPNRRPFYALHSWLIYGPKSMSETFVLFFHPLPIHFIRREKFTATIWKRFHPFLWNQEWMWKWNRAKKSSNKSRVNFFVYIL